MCYIAIVLALTLSLGNVCGFGFVPATPLHWRKSTKNFNDLRLHVNKFQAPHLDTDNTREIFCNTELTGTSIEAVGFDMDYTLAQVNKIIVLVLVHITVFVDMVCPLVCSMKPLSMNLLSKVPNKNCLDEGIPQIP